MNKHNLRLFILSFSPWPIIFSIVLIFLFINLIIFLNSGNLFYLIFNLLLVLIIIFFWWNDVLIESTYNGFHNNYITKLIIYRIITFIISEIFFFIRFFWTFFHIIFSPDVMVGSIWPYIGIYSINFLNLPLLNSLLLIRRGCWVSFRHYIILVKKNNYREFRLLITVILGLEFIILQAFEYNISIFCFSDGIFGSIFFIATGFHGIHVIIGIIFLFVMYLRIKNKHFSFNHIIGYEFSIWYWHFVDVVWLYLYIIIYWLGGFKLKLLIN